MFSALQMDSINANFIAAACYRKGSRAAWQDLETARLWERAGDIFRAAAKHLQERADADARAMAAIAEWESVNSWENMPCGEEG